MATEVGTAYVAIIPSAKGFARNLQKEIAKEFADSNLDRMVADALGDTRIRLQVEPVIDTSRIQSTAGQAVRLPVAVDDRQAAEEVADAARHAERSAPRVRLRVDVDDNSARGVGRLTSLARSMLGGLSSAASTLTGVISNATSSLAGMGTTLLAVGAGAVFAVPATYLLGGAIGSLPAIIAGAVAALGALSLGMMGIADHFKDVGGSGGGAGQNLAAQARQVAQATRGVEAAQRSLARAQREVVLAQQAVTRARADEVERLQDLNRSVKRARLDEEDAIRAVKEAELALADARATGRSDEIKEALSAYQRAVLDLEDAKDATEDLTAEQAKAAKVGVEGSDQVQDALRRQQDAIEGVTAANEQLLSAQEALQAANEKPGGAGGGGAAKELLKLAPAAQRFVDAIKSLKPAFERLRLGVQQKLFAGLDKTVKSLATAWFPQLNKTLGDYASTFNRLTKQAAASLSQKSFIDNFAAGAESARKALEKIGVAVSGPLVDAFGRLSRAAGPFVERLGDEVASLLVDFSAWIEEMDESGGLDRFFVRAEQVLGDVFDMGRDIASIFGSVMEILFGKDEEVVTTSPWEAFKLLLDDLAAWFRDPENQQKIRDFLGEIKQLITVELPEAIRTVKEMIDTVDGWFKTIERWEQRIEGFRLRVSTAFSLVGASLRSVGSPITTALGHFTRLRDGVVGQARTVVATMQGLPGRIRSALGNTGTLLLQAGRNVVQGLIDGIRQRIPSLASIASQLAGTIRAYLPFSPAKTGPLSGRGNPFYSGQSIVKLLASGVTSTLGAAESAASDLAGAFALAGSPVSGLSLPAGGATPAPGTPTLAFAGDAPDSFIRWVRENTRIYYGGSPDAAFGS